MRQLDGLKEKTNEELLAMYDRDRQLEVKQELTLRYLYIAKAVAIQMHNLYADFMQMEDIINEGAIAIMKGIERYDPERDNKFETFISRRIRGMIIDIIRKNDWMPRNYHKQHRSIEDARTELSDRLGRPPTDDEIAGHLKMDIRKCQRLQRMSTMVNVLSLDMVTNREEEGSHLSNADQSGCEETGRGGFRRVWPDPDRGGEQTEGKGADGDFTLLCGGFKHDTDSPGAQCQ